MSEANTFRLLKRSTYDVLWKELMPSAVDLYRNELIDIIKKHGWTDIEFTDEYYKRYNDRR
jgi:hypothetical protein